MKKELLNFIKAIFIIISFYILYNLVYYGLYKIIKNSDVCMFILSVLSVLILFLIFNKTIINDFKKMPWLNNFFKYLPTYLISYGTMAICNVIIYMIVGSGSTNNAIVQDSILNSVLLQSIDVAILAPIYEEILFRLNFRKAFSKKIPYVIITGIFFGSLHLLSASSVIEFLYVIPYSIMGMMLSYIYYDSDNIFTSIMFHSINNTIALALILFGSIS